MATTPCYAPCMFHFSLNLLCSFFRITRSEGDEGAIGDLNSDGRVTRSEARAAKKAKVDIDFHSLKTPTKKTKKTKATKH